MKRFLLLVVGFIATCASAEVVGTLGTVYPITEDDFLEFIQQRLQSLQASGALDTIKRQQQARATVHLEHITPAQHLTPTQQAKSWVFNPAITLPNDILNAEGQVIAHKGTTVNPLSQVHLTRTLVFYDADDKAQVTWAVKTQQRYQGKTKLILVKGSVVKEAQRFKVPVFFDQAGSLTTRFHIYHTPALVTQAGLMLRIQELKP